LKVYSSDQTQSNIQYEDNIYKIIKTNIRINENMLMFPSKMYYTYIKITFS